MCAVLVSNVPVMSIIDSGSGRSFVSRKFLSSLPRPLEEQPIQIHSTGINGNSLLCKSSVVVPVKFSYDGVSFVSPIPCAVLENNVCDLLLGNDVLCKHHASMDWRTSVLCLRADSNSPWIRLACESISSHPQSSRFIALTLDEPFTALPGQEFFVRCSVAPEHLSVVGSSEFIMCDSDPVLALKSHIRVARGKQQLLNGKTSIVLLNVSKQPVSLTKDSRIALCEVLQDEDDVRFRLKFSISSGRER